MQTMTNEQVHSSITRNTWVRATPIPMINRLTKGGVTLAMKLEKLEMADLPASALRNQRKINANFQYSSPSIPV